MNSLMAGRTPLQTMVSKQLEMAREKIAAAKALPVAREKVASAGEIDFNSPDEVEKLASAFDEAALLLKEAGDKVDNGGESKQGGMQLANNTATPGTQSYKKDGSKKHSPPMKTGLQTGSDAGPSKTHMPVDDTHTPGGAPYPKEGVLKTAMEIPAGGVARDAESSASGVGKGFFGRTAEKVQHHGGKALNYAKHNKGKVGLGVAAAGAVGLGAKKVLGKDKKSSAALEYVLGLTKAAESKQGGEVTPHFKSGEGPKPPSDSKGGNEVRRFLESNEAATNMKKVDGKAPQKRMLAEVLTEPAMSSKTDKTVNENLRNAAKGGVKIAAAKALLTKIASDPSDPRHEQLMNSLRNRK